MSNKNNKVSLSDRINNPDRMSRAINTILNTQENGGNEVNEKPLVKPLGNTKINTKINYNNKTKDVTTTKTKTETLAETITRMVSEIEKIQIEELSPLSLDESKINKKDKLKFDDRNPIISFPARPELDSIINLIHKRTKVKKYKIFELLILNGLKNTKF